ncbi:spore maturation protein [Caldithrix abyssi]|uniref:Nucleoside recognition domain protein n=1 Tax=Caldithrix abyssi DSM 13497 TaxID=880073 RepID=H1XW76_CALAY|nr:spore maturation protein [Caldithrix abyssi]APF19035.1 spore maturation protein B [Caldithrix abyssi DSM 13497]EHO42981.1 nucleoside recognition domain protein [Caldithrix abyssi DSM 13497]
MFKLIIDWLSILAIPVILLLFIGYGYSKKVKVYEEFVEGAKEGFNVGVKIIPYLVAMLVAIGMFRACGALEFLTNILGSVTSKIGIPGEILPMAFMRPLSGSGSISVMTEIMKTYGVDSLYGFMASTMFGSTETTLYVVAVYFGAINVRKTRYAVPAGLLADLAGLITAVYICRLMF